MPTVTGGPVANVLGLFSSFVSGSRLVDGGDLSQMAGFIFGYNPTAQTGTTASTSVAALAVPTMGYGWNVVSASVSAGGFYLPNALPGASVTINNEGASIITVYAQAANVNNAGAADGIIPYNPASNSGSVTAATANVSTARASVFMCIAAGTWKQVYWANA